MDEKQYIRDLAKKYAECAISQDQEKKRALWRDHYDFQGTRPLLVTSNYLLHDFFNDHDRQVCSDEYLRKWEIQLRRTLLNIEFRDDSVFKPWFQINAVREGSDDRWGLPVRMGVAKAAKGARPFYPSLVHEDDFYKMVARPHRIDEVKTNQEIERAADLFDGILPVAVDRGPLYISFGGDISTDITMMRGMEQLMLDMYDRPEWLHKVLAFMRDAILKNHDEAEAAGDFSSISQHTQEMPYSNRTADPKINDYNRKRKELWLFMAAQEFTLMSPDLFNEFMLEYQIPIMNHYACVAYGCCENLTDKIIHLKKIKNLKQIAVTPWADPEACARQIGNQYIVSWRPNPALIISDSLDEGFVRKHVREHMKIFERYGCSININIKDVMRYGCKENLIKLNRVIMEEISS
ncbi:MAG TPA: hypothetical protein DD727_08305 [Clostridiales bacterium]|nr:hypothetical protein [Clostridiales bacterium]